MSTYGSSKSSSGPSESSSRVESSSEPVDCICNVAASHSSTVDSGGGAYQVEFIVAALGTCDVMVLGLRSSYGGDHDFTSVPQAVLAGNDGVFIYTRDGDPSGDVIFVRYRCENGHEEEISFSIP